MSDRAQRRGSGVVSTMLMVAVVAACAGESRETVDSAADATLRTGSSSTQPQRASERRSEESLAALCERIGDDESLTPSGAEPLPHPGVEAANSGRRCMTLFGVDMPIGALRSFYRSTLRDLGYEVTSYREGDGIVTGNLSRTFLLATRPGRRVNVQIEEFDPAETTLARHTANVKLQIDAMRD